MITHMVTCTSTNMYAYMYMIAVYYSTPQVKSMKKPPDGVKLTMEAVCILFGIQPKRVTNKDGKKVDDYWEVSETIANKGEKDQYFWEVREQHFHDPLFSSLKPR